MKKISILCAAAAALLSGCSSGQEWWSQTAGDDAGQVEFRCLPDASVTERTRATAELPASCIPSPDQFRLTVSNTSGSYYQEYAGLSAYDKPYMTAGAYTVTASYGDPEAEGVTACCFEGSTDFTIVARKTVDAVITACLSNSAVRLTTTDWFDKYYSDATFTVTTGAGNQFSFSSSSDLLIFVQAGTTLRLKGSAVKTNGVKVEFPEYEIGSTEAQTQHTITVDASQVGGTTLTVRLNDELTEVTPVEVELNPEA